jgi:hypothetical protein
MADPMGMSPAWLRVVAVLALAPACANTGSASAALDENGEDASTIDDSGGHAMSPDGATLGPPDAGAVTDGPTTTSLVDASPSGEAGSSVADAAMPTSSSYALNPPKQCDNQFFVTGCQTGMASSTCDGVCAAANACESLSGKPGADVGFLCPRFMLFSDEMGQAAKDDSTANPPFNYAIVGHDVDTGGLDGNDMSTCCQCYQLVFDLPENEAQDNGNGASAIAVPPPLIVQTFNTSAGGGHNFDVFMGAGGFGSFNACDPNFTQMPSPSGLYMYTQFPDAGEPGNGGEKAAILPECKTSENLVTSATLMSDSCENQITSDCSQVASASPTVTAETTRSCEQ